MKQQKSHYFKWGLTVFLTVCADILKLKTLRKLEVKLNSTAPSSAI